MTSRLCQVCDEVQRRIQYAYILRGCATILSVEERAGKPCSPCSHMTLSVWSVGDHTHNYLFRLFSRSNTNDLCQILQAAEPVGVLPPSGSDLSYRIFPSIEKVRKDRLFGTGPLINIKPNLAENSVGGANAEGHPKLHISLHGEYTCWHALC